MPQITLHPSGDVDINLPNLERIDLEDLAAVRFFKKETRDGITTIEINFEPDGSFLIQYDDTGKLLTLKGSNVGIGTKDEKIFILRPNRGGPSRIEILKPSSAA